MGDPSDDSDSAVEKRTKVWRVQAAIGWGVVVMGAWTSLQALHDKRESESSRSWPTTSGEVSSSTVIHGSTGIRHRRSCDWPEVCFNYVVSGGAHKSCRAMLEKTCEFSTARKVTERYPLGAQVRVAYNPDDPDAAVLEPGSWNGERGLKVSLLIGCAGLTYGLFATTRLRQISKVKSAK